MSKSVGETASFGTHGQVANPIGVWVEFFVLPTPYAHVVPPKLSRTTRDLLVQKLESCASLLQSLDLLLNKLRINPYLDTQQIANDRAAMKPLYSCCLYIGRQEKTATCKNSLNSGGDRCRKTPLRQDQGLVGPTIDHASKTAFSCPSRLITSLTFNFCAKPTGSASISPRKCG